jgi:hypothetical protein
MAALYVGLGELPLVTPEGARTTAAIAQSSVPMVIRNIPVAIEESKKEGSNPLTVTAALMGGFTTEYNPKDDLRGPSSQAFMGTIRNARKEELSAILQRRTEVTEDELREAYDGAATKELEALQEIQKSVSAYRAANRQLGKSPDSGLDDTLKEAGMSGPLRDMVISGKFEPQPIKEDFLQSAEETTIGRVRGISERQREELPLLTRERRVMLQRIREEWIEENLTQGGN